MLAPAFGIATKWSVKLVSFPLRTGKTWPNWRTVGGWSFPSSEAATSSADVISALRGSGRNVTTCSPLEYPVARMTTRGACTFGPARNATIANVSANTTNPTEQRNHRCLRTSAISRRILLGAHISNRSGPCGFVSAEASTNCVPHSRQERTPSSLSRPQYVHRFIKDRDARLTLRMRRRGRLRADPPHGLDVPLRSGQSYPCFVGPHLSGVWA